MSTKMIFRCILKNSNHLHTSSINVIIGACSLAKGFNTQSPSKIDVRKEYDGF